MCGQMQTIVFHGFAYTCCTASSQLFCGMSAIRFNVLDDRAFPQVCSRTLVKCKGSGFLWFTVDFYSLKGVGWWKIGHKTGYLLWNIYDSLEKMWGNR